MSKCPFGIYLCHILCCGVGLEDRCRWQVQESVQTATRSCWIDREGCEDDSQGCGKDSQHCVKDSQGCVRDSQVCVKDSQGCEDDSQGCGKGSQHCVKDSQGCGKDSRGCEKDSRLAAALGASSPASKLRRAIGPLLPLPISGDYREIATNRLRAQSGRVCAAHLPLDWRASGTRQDTNTFNPDIRKRRKTCLEC